MEVIIMGDPENLSPGGSGLRIRNIPALVSIPFQLLTLLSLTIVFWSEIVAFVTFLLGFWGLILVIKKPRLKGKILSWCAIFVGGAIPQLYGFIIEIPGSDPRTYPFLIMSAVLLVTGFSMVILGFSKLRSEKPGFLFIAGIICIIVASYLCLLPPALLQ